ncbi:hypothetical protein BB559_002744 [Furculomyces boomerangus]|uniref:Uncharacterized protein n=2 Tax=Harpellales TaxID=61421 RepID=A0A2T9YSZ1_9FUNG|nr:hypothetical protein BB559_002744 [Furculomyces boomerangus]PVZ97329.1 hypothetical protein BB558_006690 [Smittium angustum]PVZ99181.1 hypothetical protein BB558_004811 [Smittium angustum]
MPQTNQPTSTPKKETTVEKSTRQSKFKFKTTESSDSNGWVVIEKDSDKSK